LAIVACARYVGEQRNRFGGRQLRSWQTKTDVKSAPNLPDSVD
jgi:hypothetical protein